MATAQTHSSPQLSRRRRIIFSLVLLAFAAVMAFAVAEIALRLLPIPGVKYHSFRYNELTGGRYYPKTKVLYRNARGDHVVRTVNDWGFLDRDVTAKVPGTFRIGFFGDSYTEAQQVELAETFIRQSEIRLNAAGDNVECVILGLSGYGTLQAYLECMQWMDEAQLDWVVYSFVENDPGDLIREVKGSDAVPLAYLDNGALAIDNTFRERYAYKTRQPHRTFQYLKSRSLLLGVLETRLKLLKARGIKTKVTEADMKMAESTAANTAPNQNVPPRQWPDSLRHYTETVAEQVLTRWADDVRNSGRGFTVVYIPREEQMAKPYAEQDSWVSWLSSVCRAHQIDFVDPSPNLIASFERGTEVYYDHFTPEGHDAVTDAVVEYFERVDRTARE